VNKLRLNKYIIAFCAGLLAVPGFAPLGIFPLPVLALTILFTQWQFAENARIAAKLGWCFGFGLFSAGVGWIYVALHDYGDMPFILALPATALFTAFLALFTALAAYAQARIPAPAWIRLTLLMPAIWVLLEWLRGTIFTGFPWLSFGYSQAAASPLAGYAPILGVYGVSLLLAVSAGLFSFLWLVRWSRQGKITMAILAMLWVSGVTLRTVQWTQAQGAPTKVSLIQGNIPQDLKFNQDKLVDTLETYRRLVQHSDARLIVLPETAIPLLQQQIPENYTAILRDHVRQNGGDIIIGAFEREQGRSFNSVFSIGTAPSQSYRKNHLVVFGEFIPLRPLLGWFINEVLNIPMGDLARGGTSQPPLAVAGQKVAMNICYEDVFGEEIIRPLPQATLLVNVSNDAWYGNSDAAMQHNQISQMRSLESGRMMLRATNTGVTSIIGRNGKILQMLPQHVEGTLNGMVQGYVGSTPYVRFGNALVMGLIALMLVGAEWMRRRSRKRGFC